MIEVKHLTKKYGDHYAVKDLSFKLESGKIYGLLGPNGAGKSTTMNMITGYIASTDGDVTINGFNILTEPEKAKKCIGYLPEIPPLYVDMSVYEYLITVAELKKVPGKERKSMVERAMERVMITDMRNRLIKNLSKGYRQRVGIAQAIIGNPEIIILDEPTVGLDPKQIIEIRDLVKSLGQEHTVILSSHILQEISAVCDEILIINKGQLVAQGATRDLEQDASGRTLEMIADGEEKRVREILYGISDLRSWETEKDAEDGLLHIRIRTAEDVDPRRELFFRFADLRIPILEMHSQTRTLEEVFLELTGNGANENRSEVKKP